MEVRDGGGRRRGAGLQTIERSVHGFGHAARAQHQAPGPALIHGLQGGALASTTVMWKMPQKQGVFLNSLSSWLISEPIISQSLAR